MDSMKWVNEQEMKMTQAVQFRKSGKILICVIVRSIMCTTSEFRRHGARSTVYGGYDIGVFNIGTLVQNGTQVWFSRGTILQEYGNDVNYYRRSISKAYCVVQSHKDTFFFKRLNEYSIFISGGKLLQ